MCKPAGPTCNLQCRYCFYTEKDVLFEEDAAPRMSDEVLETYIRKYIESAPGGEINFAWQGGEPTLMGLDFFQKVVQLQNKYGKNRRISNSFQTNGILIDDEWASFFADNNFLIGLSIDGPREVHDAYRVGAGGEPTFDRVMSAMERLQKHGAEYNVLASVTPESAARPLEIYNFFKDTDTQFVQFIPIVERVPDEHSREIGLELAEPRPGDPDDPREVTSWSVSGEEYGHFLISIFDEWVQKDVGQFYVQLFDVALAAWMGQEPPLCNFAKKCGNAMVIEHTGDIYSCDHFVYPDHHLGNIMTDSLDDMVSHPRVRELGDFKWEGLPGQCRECEVLFACHGGCPKNRFALTADGETGLNYLCEGYRNFFSHVDPKMREMARLLKQGRPAADIMKDRKDRQKRESSILTPDFGDVGRNDPCPCGSGRKFKKCCGRR